jgi:hypothetical protein
MLHRLQNQELVNALAGAGPCLEVLVLLDGDLGSAPPSLSAGALCTIRVRVAEVRPFHLIFSSSSPP